jgi:hypothetical protein
MMQAKWKIFRVANYIQLVLTVLLLGIVGFTYFSVDNSILDWTMLFFLSLVIIIVNNGFNLHLLQQYFPDKVLPEGKSKMFTILFILFLLVLVAFIIISVSGLIALFSMRGRSGNAGFIGVGIFLFETLLGLYILVIQAGLPLFIERNNRREMQRALDQLGKEEPHN